MSATVPPPARRWRRNVFLAVSGGLTVVVIGLAHGVILPFVLAIVIAYVLFPVVAWVERMRVPRAVAILAVYFVLIGSIAGFVRISAPRMGQELANLRREMPELAREANERWIPAVQERLRRFGIGAVAKEPRATEAAENAAIVARPQPDGSIAIDVGAGVAVVETKNGYVIKPVREHHAEPFDLNRFLSDVVGKSFDYAQDNALEIARIGRSIVAGVSRAVFLFFITLMLAAYIMMTREKIYDFAASLVRPSSRASFDRFVTRVDQGLSGVVRGQLIICLVNGVLSAVGFAIVGLKYWPVMALIAAVLSLIPIFGSIVSSIPAVAIGLTQGIGTAAFVLAWIVGIHQLEANFLNPKIMGDAAKIHPVLVVFSLLLGEHYFGAVGALLAVPCMSLAKSVFLHFREVAYVDDTGSIAPPAASS